MTRACALLLATLLGPAAGAAGEPAGAGRGSATAPAGGTAAPPRRIEAPEHPPAPPPPGASPLAGPRGAIDWQRRVVLCGGVAPPTLAEENENVAVTRLRTGRAARAAAVGACLAALRGVTVAEGVPADDLMARDPALVRDLERAIRRAPVDDAPRLFSDGGVAVRLAVPIDGPVSDLLFAAADRARAPPRR